MRIEDAQEAKYVVIEQPCLIHEPETVRYFLRYFLTHEAAYRAYALAGYGTMICEVLDQK